MKKTVTKWRKTPVEFGVIKAGKLAGAALDVFEYEPITGIVSKDLQGVSANTLSPEEFTLSKTISFMTREDKNGLVRDAYDLYKLSDILNVFSVVKKYKTKIRRKVDVVQHNFMTFYENLKYASIAVEPLLKSPVDHDAVENFMRKIEKLML